MDDGCHGFGQGIPHIVSICDVCSDFSYITGSSLVHTETVYLCCIYVGLNILYEEEVDSV